MGSQKRIIVCLHLVAALLQLAPALGFDGAAYKDPHYAGNRTTMVHLFEWKFADIANECETFLGPLGFGGVQVSPITENLILDGRPWYERYQPISYKFITRSGDEKAFADMVSRCNAAGVRIYADAVINHMAADHQSAVGTGGSTADPGARQYPAVPYGPNDFHRSNCQIVNYQNADEVRNCELSGLHDLDQSTEYVRGKIVDYLNRVIDLGVAGFRIDAAKHMWPADLEVIYGRLKNLREDVFGPNERPFVYQEVIDLGGEAVRKTEYNGLAAVIEFVFGAVLGSEFRGSEPLKDLQAWGSDQRGLLPGDDALVMVDNHDNQRGHGAGGGSILNYKSPRQYKMAIAFMLAHPYGHAQLMSSFDFADPSQGPPADGDGNIISPDPSPGDVAAGQDAAPCEHGWVCEHRWSPVYGMVVFRNVAKGADLKNWWSNDDNQIAFSRGDRGFVAFNGQSGADLKQTLQTGLPAGEYCDVISGRKLGGKCTGKSVTVKDDGTAYIEILQNEEDGVLGIHAQSKL